MSRERHVDVPQDKVRPGDIAHHHTLDPREVVGVDHEEGVVSLMLASRASRDLPIGNYTYTRKVIPSGG